MKHKNLLLYAALCLTTISCTVRISQTEGLSTDITKSGKLWASLWQQRAAEYDALCFQAYNIARLRLDKSVAEGRPKPLAIVTDIDETVLDNSPNAVHQALQGKDFEQEAWYKWTSKAACDTIPGSASFFKYAASRGVAVFYITNRDEREREATLKNLKKYGFPNADNEHLLLKQATSGKESRRTTVLKTHEIILLIGDNLSDFTSLFDKKPEQERMKVTQTQSENFGKLFIVLPNATYGDWENAIFKYNYQLSPAQKEEAIKNSLQKE